MAKAPAKPAPANKGAPAPAAATKGAPANSGAQWPPSPSMDINHLRMIVLSEMFLINTVEKSKKYEIKDDYGSNIFRAEANGGCCCCRFTNIKLFSIPEQKEVIHLERPCACSKCWCLCCCLQKVIVSAPPAVKIGTIEKQWGCKPLILIKNIKGETVFQVVAPCSACCNSKTDFMVQKPDGSMVAVISKNLNDLAKEFFKVNEIFGIDFYIGLDLWMKSMLLAVTFLVNYLYFECC